MLGFRLKMGSKKLWQHLLLTIFLFSCFNFVIARLIGSVTLAGLVIDLTICLGGLGLQKYLFDDRLFIGSEWQHISKIGEKTGHLLAVKFKDRFKFRSSTNRLGGNHFFLRLAFSSLVVVLLLNMVTGYASASAVLLSLCIALTINPIFLTLPLLVSSLAIIHALHESDLLNKWSGLLLILPVFLQWIYFCWRYLLTKQTMQLFEHTKVASRPSASWLQTSLLFVIFSLLIFSILPKKIDPPHYKIRKNPEPTDVSNSFQSPSPRNLSPDTQTNSLNRSQATQYQNQSISAKKRGSSGLDASTMSDSENTQGIPHEQNGSAINIAELPMKNSKSELDSASQQNTGPSRFGNAQDKSTTKGFSATSSEDLVEVTSRNENSHNQLPTENSIKESPTKQRFEIPKVKLSFPKILLIVPIILVILAMLLTNPKNKSRPDQGSKKLSKSQKQAYIDQFRRELVALANLSPASGENARQQIIIVYNLLLQHLARCGLPKPDFFTPDEFALHKSQLKFRYADIMWQLTQVFCAAYYGQIQPSPKSYQTFLTNSARLGLEAPLDPKTYFSQSSTLAD